MDGNWDQVKVITEERDGRWYWGYRLLGKMYWCRDLGLRTEAQAREEAWHELRRHLEELARGGRPFSDAQTPRTIH